MTVTSILGDSFGGLGFFILEGYRRSFPTELYFGAIPSILLAFVVDLAADPVPGPDHAVATRQRGTEPATLDRR